VTLLGEFRTWRYYFLDLPLWSCGLRGPHLAGNIRKYLEPDAVAIRSGYEKLCGYLGISPSQVDDTVKKALLVKVVRESDAYTSLRMSGKHIDRYFQVRGIDHLKAARKHNRPVVLLTGHFGSFFIPAIAFSQAGFDVYPIARTVDRSSATPLSTRIYLTLNYKFSERRFPAGYIYTDFAGWISRKVINVLRSGGILWTAIDFPARLYPHKRLPVRLLGFSSSLPSGMISCALRRGAVFLTAWNGIETTDGRNWYRLLTVDEPIQGETSQHILQAYADRLTEKISSQPWQWMGLPIVSQYNEGETGETRDD
jgi:lauroyl/myristoyl acyltransferase